MQAGELQPRKLDSRPGVPFEGRPYARVCEPARRCVHRLQRAGVLSACAQMQSFMRAAPSS